MSYRTGKRDSANTDDFIQDLRRRVIGAPEISADGLKPYQVAVRDAFRSSAFGTITKTYSVTDLPRPRDDPHHARRGLWGIASALLTVRENDEAAN